MYVWCIFHFIDITLKFNQPVYTVDEDAGAIPCMIVMSGQSSTNINAQVITADGSAMGESCSILITIDTVVV